MPIEKNHAIACRVEIDGLFIKGSGTYKKGHIFQIEDVPAKLMEKCKNNETHQHHNGKVTPICLFLTPQGAWVDIKSTNLVPDTVVDKKKPDKIVTTDSVKPIKTIKKIKKIK